MENEKEGFKIPNSWFWAALILAAFAAFMWYLASQRNIGNEIKANKAKQEQLQDSINANKAAQATNATANESQAHEAVTIGKRAAKRVNAPIAVREVDSLWVEIEREENNKEL